MLEDLRDVVRRLRRRPGPSLAVAGVLALGVGASTTVFSVVDGVLLTPLPYPEPQQLVRVFETHPETGLTQEGPSPLNFVDWTGASERFAHLAAWYTRPAALRGDGGPPEAVETTKVSPAFFAVLGVQPAAGRWWAPDLRGAAVTGASQYVSGDRLAVLSHGLWQRRYGGDPGVVGREIEIERVAWRVVAVAPEGFAMPSETTDAWLAWDIPQTYARMDLAPGEGRDWRFLEVIGRLDAGASLAEGRAEMSALAAALAERFPGTNAGWAVRVVPLRESLVGHAREGLLVLLLAVGFVLAIACADAAGLQLAVSSERSRELALRRALGASESRLRRQLRLEGLLVGLAGGVPGLALAALSVAALARLRPDGLPRLDEIGVDVRVATFAVVAAALAGLASAWIPTRQVLAADTGPALREGSRGAAGVGRGRLRARRVLVSAQAALALMLLAGALLFTRSFLRVVAVDPGFDTEGLLVARMRVESGAGPFYRSLLERLEALPGVRSAAAVTALPMSEIGPDFDRPYWRAEEPRPDVTRLADIRMATPDYFETLGLPLLAGRRFDDRDAQDSPRVAAVSRGLARRAWGEADPIGRRLTIDYRGGAYDYEVVAVVGDTRFRGLRSEPRPEIYLPHQQVPYLEMNVAVRADVPPESLVPAVRRAVAGIDPDQPVHSLVTMDQLLSRSSARDRLAALLLASLAGLAVALAAAGLYALQAFTVGRRTAEIGVRMALGARRREIAELVVREALGTALPGALAGLALALALARAVQGMLFGVSPLDPVALGGAAAAIVAVALLAAALPAARAARVEPTEALRAE